jgi:hypothetical protein
VSEFILMLTRNDETVPDARALHEQLSATGATHFGCKDIGLPATELRALLEDMRSAGHTSYLEVVSETPEATLESARVATELRPDYLIGGTLIEPIQAVLAGTGVGFFPYIGRVIGHPCLLRGSIDEIAADARAAEAAGVDGINLLAYRYDGDVQELVRAVSAATYLRLISAGSIDSLARVHAMAELGLWAFTIGTAVLDRAIVPGASLERQVYAVLETLAATAAEGAR